MGCFASRKASGVAGAGMGSWEAWGEGAGGEVRGGSLGSGLRVQRATALRRRRTVCGTSDTGLIRGLTVVTGRTVVVGAAGSWKLGEGRGSDCGEAS
jgi:hypothetical protein